MTAAALTLVPDLIEQPVTTVYTTPKCSQCNMTKTELDKKGITYQVVDLSQDAQALAAVRALGYMSAPVVITTVPGQPDDHWYGFRPDKIAEIHTRWQAAA